eukprot:6210326-Pleurochrysis_carterae.AAC.2
MAKVQKQKVVLTAALRGRNCTRLHATQYVAKAAKTSRRARQRKDANIQCVVLRSSSNASQNDLTNYCNHDKEDEITPLAPNGKPYISASLGFPNNPACAVRLPCLAMYQTSSLQR